MIADLKPYPIVKDSGVEWLGKVPAHWDISTLRRKLRPFDGIKIGPFGSQLKLEQMSDSGYKVYGQANVISRDFSGGTKFVGQEKFDELSACEVLPGDLLVTMMGTSGRCARVPNDATLGIMDSHLLRLRTDESISARFVTLLIDESPYLKEQITVAGKGSIMHGLNSGIIKALILAVPPFSEQSAIVSFLDHADRCIRCYILAKQKLIALLEEQKQAIIHQAVTGKIDVRTGQPYPAFKDSGVEWLGDVPEHWRRISLGAAADSVQTGPFGSQLHASDYVSGGIPVINPSHMRNSIIEPDPSISISQEKAEELSRHELKPGDIVMARRGEMGRCALVTEIEAGWLCGTGSLRIRPWPGIFVPAYLLLVLNAQGVRDTLSLSSIGATMDNLNAGMVSRLVFPELPFPEQIAIVNFVDKWKTNIDNAIDCSRRQIKLLQKYRTRLIADVVTGKVDVREAAAGLPEVDPLAEDDLDGAIHGGENSNLHERDPEESAEEYTIEEEVTE